MGTHCHHGRMRAVAAMHCYRIVPAAGPAQRAADGGRG